MATNHAALTSIGRFQIPCLPSGPTTYVRRFVSGNAHRGGSGTPGGLTRMRNGVTLTHAIQSYVDTSSWSGTRGARSLSAYGQWSSEKLSQW